MASTGQHCPFLNRADVRCGEHLNIEDLSYAYRYCFDRYKACPVYVELLLERKDRRDGVDEQKEHAAGPLIQVTVTSRYRRRRTAA